MFYFVILTDCSYEILYVICTIRRLGCANVTLPLKFHEEPQSRITTSEQNLPMNRDTAIDTMEVVDLRLSREMFAMTNETDINPSNSHEDSAIWPAPVNCKMNLKNWESEL